MAVHLNSNRKGHPTMNRILAAIAATLIILISWFNAPDRRTDPETPNPSTDGRYHTCGLITEDGVTENIDIYIDRCGDTTLGSDSTTPEVCDNPIYDC